MIHGVPGSQVTGPLSDLGDGSYVQDVSWDPAFRAAGGDLAGAAGPSPGGADAVAARRGQAAPSLLDTFLLGLLLILLLVLVTWLIL